MGGHGGCGLRLDVVPVARFADRSGSKLRCERVRARAGVRAARNRKPGTERETDWHLRRCTASAIGVPVQSRHPSQHPSQHHSRKFLGQRVRGIESMGGRKGFNIWGDERASIYSNIDGSRDDEPFAVLYVRRIAIGRCCHVESTGSGGDWRGCCGGLALGIRARVRRVAAPVRGCGRRVAVGRVRKGCGLRPRAQFLRLETSDPSTRLRPSRRGLDGSVQASSLKRPPAPPRAGPRPAVPSRAAPARRGSGSARRSGQRAAAAAGAGHGSWRRGYIL